MNCRDSIALPDPIARFRGYGVTGERREGKEGGVEEKGRHYCNQSASVRAITWPKMHV